MIVCLDTAALIFAFRNGRTEELVDWLAEQDGVLTCDLVRAEIRSGILGTANARTRASQERWYADTIAQVPSRQLDRELCDQAAILCGAARRKGFQARIDDALVAAAAQAAGATVATVNVSHFAHLDVPAVNPLEA